MKEMDIFIDNNICKYKEKIKKINVKIICL